MWQEKRGDLTMRPLTIALVALLGLALAGCAGGASSTTATAAVIKLDMKEFAFSPKTIEVPVGQKVTLELKNTGTVEHDLAIDAIGFKAIAKPAQTVTRVIGPLAAGTTYPVYCSIAGHKEAGMTATLVAK